MSSKLLIPGLLVISIFGLQMQTEVCAQGQNEKKIFYELRDALRNKLNNNQAPIAPVQNQTPPLPVQQQVTQPLSQTGAMTGGLKERAKQEIQIMVDKKLGTNLSNQVNVQNAAINPNNAPVTNQSGMIPGVQNIIPNNGYAPNPQGAAVPAGQQPQSGGFNFSNLGAELKDLKVPEKYKQDYYRYRNKVKDMVK